MTMAKSVATLAIALMCGTGLCNAQPAFDDFLKTAMRKAMPPEAKCTVAAFGPFCETTDGTTTLSFYRQTGVRIRMAWPARTQVSDKLRGAWRVFLNQFGFIDAQSDACASQARELAVVRYKRPGYSGFSDSAWGPDSAAVMKTKRYKVFCAMRLQSGSYVFEALLEDNRDF